MRVVKVEFRHRRSFDGLNSYTITLENDRLTVEHVLDAYDELEAWMLARRYADASA